jgi:hypothetical protein
MRGRVALFLCRRWAREPVKTRSRKFTVKDIDPFVTVEDRDGAPHAGAVTVAIGVALQKPDGTWGVHELTDEVDGRRGLCAGASQETAGSPRSTALLETKRRLVAALNRLREHYERVYVCRRPRKDRHPVEKP